MRHALGRRFPQNTAYLYERPTEQEYGPTPPDGPHVPHRGTGRQASRLAQNIVDLRVDVPVSAHQVTTSTPRDLLSDLAAQLIARRHAAVDCRRTAYTDWLRASDGLGAVARPGRSLNRSRARRRESGIEL